MVKEKEFPEPIWSSKLEASRKLIRSTSFSTDYHGSCLIESHSDTAAIKSTRWQRQQGALDCESSRCSKCQIIETGPSRRWKSELKISKSATHASQRRALSLRSQMRPRMLETCRVMRLPPSLLDMFIASARFRLTSQHLPSMSFFHLPPAEPISAK